MNERVPVKENFMFVVSMLESCGAFGPLSRTYLSSPAWAWGDPVRKMPPLCGGIQSGKWHYSLFVEL